MPRPTLRQTLYVLNLAVGMLLFVCAYSFIDAVARSITFGLDSFGSDAIIVSERDVSFVGGGGTGSLDRQAVDRLRDGLASRYEVSSVARSFEMVSAGGAEQLVSVWRGEANLLAVAGLRLVDGRGFTPFEVASRADVCLVSEEVADTLLRTRLGRRGRVLVGGHACRVIGTVSSAEVIPTFTVARNVYAPLGWAQTANPAHRAPVSQILLRYSAGPPPDAAGDEVVRALGPDLAAVIEVWIAKDFWRLRTQVAGALRLLVMFMAAVVLGMAALGLANSLSLDVLQRRGEIGLRIALGATRRDIFAMFLAQGLAVVLIGGLLGSLAGAALTSQLIAPLVTGSALLGSVEMTIDGATVVAALLALAAAATVACVVPARRAMQVDPALAVRSL